MCHKTGRIWIRRTALLRSALLYHCRRFKSVQEIKCAILSHHGNICHKRFLASPLKRSTVQWRTHVEMCMLNRSNSKSTMLLMLWTCFGPTLLYIVNQAVVIVEIQRWGNYWWLWAPCWRFWTPCTLLVVAGPDTTKLTPLPGNQAFTFTSLTWTMSR